MRGNRTRRGGERDLHGVAGRQRSLQRQFMPARIEVHPQHAVRTAVSGHARLSGLHAFRSPALRVTRHRDRDVFNSVDEQADSHLVFPHGDVGVDDFRTARCARRRHQQALPKFVEHLRRRWIRPGPLAAGERDGEHRNSGRCAGQPQRDVRRPLPATAEDVVGEQRREQAECADRQETQGGNKPLGHDHQAHGPPGVHGTVPGQGVRGPFPIRSAWTGLQQRVFVVARQSPRRDSNLVGLVKNDVPRFNCRRCHLTRIHGRHDRGLRLAGEHLEQPPGLGMPLSVGQRFELREDGDANLGKEERHQEQQQHRERGEPIALRHPQQATLRCDTYQGDGREQVQPRPQGRRRFVETEGHRDERRRSRPATEQSGGGPGDDQQQEEIQELPATGPAGRRVVDAQGRQQLVSRRDVQRGGEGVEAGVPAGNGNRGPDVNPSLRGDFDVGIAYLHARESIVAGHEQCVAVFQRVLQYVRCCHVQSPAIEHLAGDGVGKRETRSVEVQPQPAGQVEGVVSIREPPGVLHHGQRLAGFDEECRQLGPARANPFRIHGARPLRQRRAQPGICLVGPYLLSGQVVRALGQGHAFDHTRPPRAQRDQPSAGTHLNAQVAVRCKPRREFAG